MNEILKPLKKISLLMLVFLMLSVTAYGSESRERHSDGNGSKKYYSDGSLKSVGDTSKTGQKQNKWQYFYSNGAKMSEGEYINGKMNGKWTYWSKEGALIATKNYKEGVKSSTVEKESSHETEASSASESKHSEPFVENRSGFAATMEEWKAMKARRQHMPEAKGKSSATMEEWKAMKKKGQHMSEVETSTEETHSKTVEPVSHAKQEVEIPEPVQQEVEIPEPVQEVKPQPMAEITEPVKERAPVKKKPAASGGKFWKN